MKPLNELTAIQAADAVERGQTTSAAIVRACLARIAERNHAVQAFVAYDADLALSQAERSADPVRACGTAGSAASSGGASAASAGARLPLAGVTFAAKDMFDTVDYPTEYGSPIYKGHRPRTDAACVALARHRGAHLLGKVATGEFATQTPSAARNPLRLSHTPGGSSSGSAAAVADCMVAVAFGTQTTASLVRPAVYCGVVGYKPSFGLISSAGMKGISPSQDTVGVIARDVADAAFFTFGLQGARGVSCDPVLRPRIGVCLSRQWDYAQPQTVAAIDRAADSLARAGARIERFWLPAELEAIAAMQPRLFAFEARQSLAQERLTAGELLSPRLMARLTAGEDIGLDEYVDMLQQAAAMRQRARDLFRDYDAILYPAAEGEAEEGLASAGSPRYGAIWTLLHLPSISFPIGIGAGGLPLGVQLVGAYAQDSRLLAVARFATASIETVPLDRQAA